MRTLIEPVLLEARKKLESRLPKLQKRSTKHICIDGVAPIDIPGFMVDNNIPMDAWFDNHGDEIVLAWDIHVSLTDKEIESRKRSYFENISFPMVYKTLTENGYMRHGYCSAQGRKFDTTPLLDMVINQEWDRIEQYYTLVYMFRKAES